MTILHIVSRFLKRYILNTEFVVLLIAITLIYHYVFNGHKLKTIFERWKIQMQLRLSGQYDHIPSTGDKDVTVHRTKASWELRKDAVGVYAIQGRRPHMEDRFNVVNDLEHTNTSIYGIFDGHGGEVQSFGHFME